MSQVCLEPKVRPEILAPAGDVASFLAALAAGADAAYVGMKHFSARAGADNFSLTELSRMVDLANSEGRKVYIAFNSLVKPGELPAAGRLMLRLARDVKPHAIIIQDIGLLELSRQVGYEGELHLSTLANLTHPAALRAAARLGAARVILPRELSIDEIKATAMAAPPGLNLELFIHGALCWCVSGRCYWSSYLGGKSGLRGRCVQPCRRVYSQRGREGRYFSSQDLSLDVLVKTLLDIPNLSCWKIEGRKKGPHYVYHVISAYRMLRDAYLAGGADGKTKKDAQALLDMALGRPACKALFLPQRNLPVTTPNEPTSSGLLIGKTQSEQAGNLGNARGHKPPDVKLLSFLRPRFELKPGDLLRVGYEDEAWHATLPVTSQTPKGGKFTLKVARHKTPKSGTPVFLIDRREPELKAILQDWERRLERSQAVQTQAAEFKPKLPPFAKSGKLPDILVRPSLPQGKETRGSRGRLLGLWLSPNTVRAVSKTATPRISWWLPPVIWPDDEAALQRSVIEARRNGARYFVCNSPWQIDLFAESEQGAEGCQFAGHAELIAGPFCNVSNAAAVAVLAELGFAAALVSPELSSEDLLALPGQSSLPLGIVVGGYWPVGISRQHLEHLKPNEPFASPKGEVFWGRNYSQNFWLYPGWPLDLAEHKPRLEKSGYSFFVTLEENLPTGLPQARRTSQFNWDNALL